MTYTVYGGWVVRHDVYSVRGWVVVRPEVYGVGTERM